MRSIFLAGAVLGIVFVASSRGQTHEAPNHAPSAAHKRVPVVFSGGHDVGVRDYGRPVVLIAAALGVPTEVFRQAFSGVRPAPGGTRPTREREQANKRQLLRVLAPYGVTNARLNEVSNYYRFNPRRGEMWPTEPAQAYAEVGGGKILRIVVTEGGSGYHTAPQVSVAGVAQNLQSRLSWSKTFAENGAVASVEVVPTPAR